LIIAGGFIHDVHHLNDEWLSSVEIYDPDANEWKYMKSMNDPREECGLISFPNQNNDNALMMACGGFNWNSSSLKTSEIYSYEKNEWNSVCKMKYDKKSHGIQYWADRNNIITIGGHGLNVNKSVEMFDFFQNEWHELRSTLFEHEHNPGIVVIDNIVYVVGNDGQNNNIDKQTFGVLEYYDIRINKWYKVDELTNMFHFSSIDCQKRLSQGILTI